MESTRLRLSLCGLFLTNGAGILQPQVELLNLPLQLLRRPRELYSTGVDPVRSLPFRHGAMAVSIATYAVLHVGRVSTNDAQIEAHVITTAVSSTLRAHGGMHSDKSAISLFVEGFALPTKARRVIGSRSGTQSDPCISSVTRSIMITPANSPVKESGIPK